MWKHHLQLWHMACLDRFPEWYWMVVDEVRHSLQQLPVMNCCTHHRQKFARMLQCQRRWSGSVSRRVQGELSWKTVCNCNTVTHNLEVGVWKCVCHPVRQDSEVSCIVQWNHWKFSANHLHTAASAKHASRISGGIRLVATAWQEGEILFFFCPVNTAQFHRFLVRQISRNFVHSTSIGVRMKNFGTEFRQFLRKGSFFQKKTFKMSKISSFEYFHATSCRHNSEKIIDQRKLTYCWLIYGMSTFHFYRRNKFIVRPFNVTHKGTACCLRAYIAVWPPWVHCSPSSFFLFLCSICLCLFIS